MALSFNTIVTGLAMTLIILLLVEIQQVLSFDDRVPVEFSHVEVLNSPLRSGDAIQTRIWRNKVRNDCPVFSVREAININTNISYSLIGSIWVGGEANTTFLDYEYKTLSIMPDGDYELHVDLGYLCPGITFPIEQPVAFFTIDNSVEE